MAEQAAQVGPDRVVNMARICSALPQQPSVHNSMPVACPLHCLYAIKDYLSRRQQLPKALIGR